MVTPDGVRWVRVVTPDGVRWVWMFTPDGVTGRAVPGGLGGLLPCC